MRTVGFCVVRLEFHCYTTHDVLFGLNVWRFFKRPTPKYTEQYKTRSTEHIRIASATMTTTTRLSYTIYILRHVRSHATLAPMYTHSRIHAFSPLTHNAHRAHKRDDPERTHTITCDDYATTTAVEHTHSGIRSSLIVACQMTANGECTSGDFHMPHTDTQTHTRHILDIPLRSTYTHTYKRIRYKQISLGLSCQSVCVCACVASAREARKLTQRLIDVPLLDVLHEYRVCRVCASSCVLSV